MMTQEYNDNGAVISVGSILGPLMDYRRFLSIMIAVGLVLGVLHGIFAPRVYEAKTKILPDQNSSTSFLGGAGNLALLAGITLPGSVEPSLLYKDLLSSDHFLENLLDQEGPNGTTILESLGYENDPDQRDKAVRLLKRSLDVERDARSGVVSVKMQSPAPKLSEAIVERLVSDLDIFLQSRRRTDAGNRHRFLVEEIGQAELRLSDAEDNLAEFRTANRMIDQSPALLRAQSSLNREVLLRETILVELRKQAELNAITAKEDIPTIATLGPPRSGTKAKEPKLVQSILVGVFVFLALGCMVVYFRSGVLPYVRKELARDRH